jgi:hypothetical protein
MSGFLGVLAASGGGGPVTSFIGNVTNVTIRPGFTSASGSLNIASNGVISGTHYTGNTNWFIPTTTGIGSSYWVKGVSDGFCNPTGGAVQDIVISLAAGQSWSWTVNNNYLIGTFTVYIYSDAAGTNLVGTGSISINVENTP